MSEDSGLSSAPSAHRRWCGNSSVRHGTNIHPPMLSLETQRWWADAASRDENGGVTYWPRWSVGASIFEEWVCSMCLLLRDSHELSLCPACHGFHNSDCADFARCRDYTKCVNNSTYTTGDGLYSIEYKHSLLALNCFWGKTHNVRRILSMRFECDLQVRCFKHSYIHT